MCGMCCSFSSNAADATHMPSSVMASMSRESAQEIKKKGSLITQGFGTMSILGTPAVGTKRQQEHKDFAWSSIFLLFFTHKP